MHVTAMVFVSVLLQMLTVSVAERHNCTADVVKRVPEGEGGGGGGFLRCVGGIFVLGNPTTYIRVRWYCLFNVKLRYTIDVH